MLARRSACPAHDTVRSRSAAVLLILCPVLMLGACSSPDTTQLDEYEKAKLITSHQKAGRLAYEKWLTSEPPDFEALKDSAKKYVASAKVSPGACPSCYSMAAVRLREVGLYHRNQAFEIRRELEDAAPADRARLQKDLDAKQELIDEYFRESLGMFRAYFTTSGGYADPDAYLACVDMYQELKRWGQALQYLDLLRRKLEGSGELTDASADNIQKLRRNLERNLRLDEERRLEKDLEIDGIRRPPSGVPQTAN